MAEDDEVQLSSFLPMDLDISWGEEDDFFQELPRQPHEKFSRLSISSLDVDFRRLAQRRENTSTPFVPRATLCKSPTGALHPFSISQDSGYDAESSTVSSCAFLSTTTSSEAGDCPQYGFIPITAPKDHRDRRSIESDALPEEDVVLGCELETDSAYDETSSICSVQSQTLSDVISTSPTSCDSQSMDIVFRALDLNSSGYSSMDSSRSCSQHNLAAEAEVVVSSESESSCESQVSVVEMVCVTLERALPMFSKAISDRLIGRKMGLSTVDIIGELHIRNVATSLSVILTYLTAEDLTSVSCVSRTWRESVLDDPEARHRKQQYIQRLKVTRLTQKENITVRNKSSRSMVKRREAALVEIQHTGEDMDMTRTDSLSKHDQFVQEAGKLTSDQSLQKCPQCQCPARVHKVQERGLCSNSKCAHDFCTKCRGVYHGSKDCPSTIGIGPCLSKKSRTDVKIGSRKSKRNLRRL